MRKPNSEILTLAFLSSVHQSLADSYSLLECTDNEREAREIKKEITELKLLLRKLNHV